MPPTAVRLPRCLTPLSPTEMVKGLKGKMCEEQLQTLGVHSTEQRS